MLARAALAGLLLASSGCQAPAEPARAPLSEPPLVALGEARPAGLDQPPSFAVAFEGGAALDRRATRFVPRWRDGAALIDPEGRLYQVWPDGRRRMLAAGVTALAASDDAARLAYAVRTDGSLRLHDGEAERTLAEGMASIGALTFDGEAVVFVGARPAGAARGGVAGVWSADDGGARCHTNCDLRVGAGWGDRFVPPPTEPAALLEAAR